MKIALTIFLILAFSMAVPQTRAQQAQPATSTAATSPTQKTIEAYLRHLYAFGPNVALVVGAPKPTQVEGMLETNIDLTIDGNNQTVKFYVSKDGKFLFQGELSDMTKDPLAQNLAQIQMKDAPSLGDPSAAVTLVEYSDFECPVCRKLHDALREILPNYAGKVRVLFKDFPIEQLHPWARTAAIAGRCAYQQDPKAFQGMHGQSRGRRGRQRQPRERPTARCEQHADGVCEWPAHGGRGCASARAVHQLRTRPKSWKSHREEVKEGGGWNPSSQSLQTRLFSRPIS